MGARNPAAVRLCTASVSGKRECADAVPEDSAISLCLLHLLMAHQEVVGRGGARAVAETLRGAAARIAGTGVA